MIWHNCSKQGTNVVYKTEYDNNGNYQDSGWLIDYDKKVGPIYYCPWCGVKLR